MSDRHPPAFATWLAQRLMAGPRQESLLGDLIEQYRQGRSGVWYWRQVCAAIVMGTARDLASHKLLALRALAIGWTLYYLSGFPVGWGGLAAEAWVEQRIVCDSFACQFWLNQFTAQLLFYSAAAISGWIVARLHGRHWVAMVSLFAASVLLWEWGMNAWLMSQDSHPVPVSPITFFVATNLTLAGIPLSIFLGGMWAVRSEFRQHSGPPTA
jgi:hypothetical protein